MTSPIHLDDLPPGAREVVARMLPYQDRRQLARQAPGCRLAAARGDDLRARALAPFGGAGGQHACALARELGLDRVICRPFAGVLSALGIGLAPVTALARRAVGRPLAELPPGERDRLLAPLERETAERLAVEGAPATPARRALEPRYAGQETRGSVPAEGLDPRADFAAWRQRYYGFILPDRAIELYALRVERRAERSRGSLLPAPASGWSPHEPPGDDETRAWLDGRWQRTPVHERSRLRPGATLPGPAIVLDGIATVVVEPGWTGTVTARGDLLLETTRSELPEPAPRPDSAFPTSDFPLPTSPDPVELELFHRRFASVAGQMGATLRRTAISVNVKERLDFSCAWKPPAEAAGVSPRTPARRRGLRALRIWVSQRRAEGTSNVQHLTSNVEVGRAKNARVGSLLLPFSYFDVGCWMFDVGRWTFPPKAAYPTEKRSRIPNKSVRSSYFW